MATVELWHERYVKAGAETLEQKVAIILEYLDGYGVEYSIDKEADAKDLTNAIKAATQLFKFKDMPPILLT